MRLYPAIDLRDGNCVRLYQGDYDQETVYGDDPPGVAAAFEADGAGFLHVVDLDAALTGEAVNRPVIAEICERVDIPVQVGGGVRTVDAARALFDLGVERVVIGTAALEKPELVSELAGHGHRVAVGLDGRNNRVATHGWTQTSDLTVTEVAIRFADSGADALVMTDIGRDGTLEGPAIDSLTDLVAGTEIDVVASGGVGSLDDLEALARIAVPADDESGSVRRLDGAIVGKALYEKVFTVAEAVAACRFDEGNPS